MNKEKVLANCVNEILTVEGTLQGCLNRHPDLDPEVRLLLTLANDIKNNDVIPSEEFRARAQCHLLNAMKEADLRKPRRRRWFKSRSPLGQYSLLNSAAIFVAVGGGSAVLASQNGLPGDVIYPIRMATTHLASFLHIWAVP